jgi:CTP synthase
MTKFIFVLGGVISGVGKGVTTASIGNLLKAKGFKVTAMKIDPYINVDAGTMNPTEHGEVFVTEDGDETDQDIGNYERFLDQDILRDNYMTTGRVYETVIHKERNLEYEGRCVQVVPHIPDEVIRRIKNVAQKSSANFVLVEIGGTVGEYENLLFLEAGRMMKLADPKSVAFILVSFLPIPSKLGEMKTKPTQHATRALNAAGIQPDIIIARAEKPLDQPRKEKLSIFCNVAPEDVISAPDVDSIYELPILFEKEKLGDLILDKFKLKHRRSNLKEWQKMVDKIHHAKTKVRIGIVGKYFQTGDFMLADAYISVIEAIKHAAWSLDRDPEIEWLNAEKYEANADNLKELDGFDAIIVPGGFGHRGVEGKIAAIQYSREHGIPFLGLCYGLQLSVIEIARHLAGLSGAHTTEINPKTKYKVIDILPDQKQKLTDKDYGGTMRLGAFNCELDPNSRARKLYKRKQISERHRHRFEVNNQFLPALQKVGLSVAGKNKERNLVEIIEFKNHPYFVASQFHPEFKSRPLHPHPLFVGLIQAAIKKFTL